MPDIRSLRLGLRASPEVPWASEPSADQEEIVLIPSPSKMLLACAGLLAACGGGPDQPGDDDFQRHLARQMPMNKVFTDSLTWEGEDRSDWKVFNVSEPGLLKLTVRFDKPDGSCEVYLRDKYGAHMAREVQSNSPRMELVRRVEPGRFFAWIHAPDQQCSSEYAIEARVDPD